MTASTRARIVVACLGTALAVTLVVLATRARSVEEPAPRDRIASPTKASTPGLGVHFALTDDEVAELESRGNDEARREYVEEEIEKQFLETRRDDSVQTDKAWDAIHRCLTDGMLAGSASSPMEIVVLGGRSLYSGDDYIMTLKPANEVRAVVQHLARVTKASLRASYDRIDPASYSAEIGDDDFEYTWENFVDLRTFWERAAVEGRSILFTADR